MDSTIIQRLLSQLTPEQLAQFVAESEAGEVNPRLLALLDPRRRPSFSFQPREVTDDAPMLGGDVRYEIPFGKGSLNLRGGVGVDRSSATYGGDIGASIPLGKNTTLDLSAGGEAGRGYGRARGMVMPFAPRGEVKFRHEF